MRRTATVAILMSVCLVLLAGTVLAEEGNGFSLRPADPREVRYLPRRAATEFCGEEIQAALREAGLGPEPPTGYVPDGQRYTGRPCEVDCSPCGYYENEDSCYDGYIDHANGGCNSSPYAFEILTPSYGTIEVCGTGGVYDGSSTRDTDWYEITVPEQIHVTWRCTAEFFVQMTLVDADEGCAGFVILETVYADPCVEGVMELNLAPGTHWLFVATGNWSGWPCGSEYVMNFEGLFAAPDCVTQTPPGAVVENEPECEPGYWDDFNGGCNTHPAVFSPLEPSGGQIVVRGETGVYATNSLCYRDTDWYELVLDEPRDIDFCIMAGFDYQLLIVRHEDDCLNYSVTDSLTGSPCDVACDTFSLDPGIYSLWVGSWSWLPVACGRGYAVTIDGFTTPVERASWGAIKALYRR